MAPRAIAMPTYRRSGWSRWNSAQPTINLAVVMPAKSANSATLLSITPADAKRTYLAIRCPLWRRKVDDEERDQGERGVAKGGVEIRSRFRAEVRRIHGQHMADEVAVGAEVGDVAEGDERDVGGVSAT